MFRPKPKSGVSSGVKTSVKTGVKTVVKPSSKSTKQPVKPLKPLKQQKLKPNASTETLVAPPFLQILNEKASIIQKWYRSRKLARVAVRDSTSQVDEAMKRRKAMEVMLRQEIESELESEKSQLPIDEHESFGYEDDFEDLEPNVTNQELQISYQECDGESVLETDERDVSHTSPLPLQESHQESVLESQGETVDEYNTSEQNLVDEAEPEYLVHYTPTPLPEEPEHAISDSLSQCSTPRMSSRVLDDIESLDTCDVDTNHGHESVLPDDSISVHSTPRATHQLEHVNEYRSTSGTPKPESTVSYVKSRVPQQKSPRYQDTPPSPSYTSQRSHKYQEPRYSDEDTTSKSVSRIFNLLNSVSAPVPTAVTVPLQQPEQPDATIFASIKSKMMQQSLDIDQKSKVIDSLKQELSRLREHHKQQLEEHSKSSKSQLSLQRKEYEAIVKRHLGFIDTVLAEKEQLTKKTIELSQQLKTMSQSHSEKLEAVQNDHDRILKQQKEVWMASEKQKRDKWVVQYTKTIKDQTVASLEPEIQKLISSHKSALRQAEESYATSLMKEKQSLQQQHERQVEGLRQQFHTERQTACEQEREFARQRYTQQLEREQQQFTSMKQKLVLEFEHERGLMKEGFSERIKEVEMASKRSLAALRKEMEEERNRSQESLEQERKKQDSEKSKLYQQYQIEKQEWQTQYMKKIEGQVRLRETEFKKQVLKQRDQEIELVIQRLESESGSTTSDTTRRYRMDIERIKSESAQEMKELRDQHSMALDKLLTAQNNLSGRDEEIRGLRKEILKMEHQMITKDNLIKKQKQELERLLLVESELKDQIRIDFEHELKGFGLQVEELQSTIRELENTLSHERNASKSKIQQLLKENQQTLAIVEERVKETIALKDSQIIEIKEQLNDSNLKSKYLQDLIDKQRQVFWFD